MTFEITAVATNHIAVLGKTGSGKTSTSKYIVEQMVARNHRVCTLDTTKSDWWGITSSASGKRAGLPFKILGGPRGHLPLHSSAGSATAPCPRIGGESWWWRGSRVTHLVRLSTE